MNIVYSDTPIVPDIVRPGQKHRGANRSGPSGKSGKSGKSVRKPLHFVGIDGEGVTDRSTDESLHTYGMLSIDDQTIINNDGLQWWEIFRFIHDYQVDNPQAIMVGFFLKYDFTNWIKTFTQERAAMLISKPGMAARRRTASGGNTKPFPVRYRDPSGVEWEFDMLPGRRLNLRPVGHKTWAYVMDAGPFWQCSFLKAIDPARWPTPICSDADYATILEGKSKRSSSDAFDRDMIRYNVTENRVLAAIMTELRTAFESIGVKLSRTAWFGPGQAAQAWVAGTGFTQPTLPGHVLRTAWASYYGGRFEIFAHGHVGDAHEYDINSAYPWAITKLPCLEHGCWVRDAIGPHEFQLVHCSYFGSDPHAGGLPHRMKSGHIVFPQNGKGWYWDHEIRAAINAGLIDTVIVHETLTYLPCSCPKPFAVPLRELYLKRLEVGKNTPFGVAMKLVYNSLYGKFAQSVGAPKYGNPVYASYITSICRSMILDAVASHPERSGALRMIATDGVYFSTPHPGLPLSDTELGLWDTSKKINLTLIMPGVYWDNKARLAIATGKSVQFKSRGVSAAYLAPHIERIDTQFAELAAGAVSEWPTATYPIPFSMTSATQALARGKWHTAGQVIEDGMRAIDTQPFIKRTDPYVIDGVIHSRPYPQGITFETTPYDQADMISLDGELMSVTDARNQDEQLAPGGSVDQEFYDWMQG